MEKWLALMMLQNNIKDHNLYYPQLSDHPPRILITGGSGSRKTNPLFNLIHHQSDIDEIHLNVKNPFEAKYQLLLNKRESTGLKKQNI